MYNPNTDEWTEKAHIPTNIANSLISTLMDDKIVVFVGESSTLENKVVVYDPKTSVWQEIYSAANMDRTYFYDVTFGVTTGLYAPKRIYIFHETRTTIYDPIKNTWTTAKPMPTARRQSSVAVIDDILYVIGGYTIHEFDPPVSYVPMFRREKSNVNEQYIPIGYRSVPNTESAKSIITSEPEPSKPSSTYIIAVTVALTVGIVGSLILYFNNKKES
jgi:N-acetylneuraminic acid mutarotase